MKQNTAAFLRVLTALLGVCALGLLLWEPHLEGRNANATPFEIYFKDPFLAYVYIASLPFFAGLRQAYKALGLAGQPGWPRTAARPLGVIKYCAIAVVLFAALGEVFIMSNASDDRAGGVVMGGAIALVSGLTAAAAAKLQRLAQKGR